jgi:hypothetical protein
MQNQKEPALWEKKIVSQRSKYNAWAVADVMEPTRTELTEQSNKVNAFLTSNKMTVIQTKLEALRGIT